MKLLEVNLRLTVVDVEREVPESVFDLFQRTVLSDPHDP